MFWQPIWKLVAIVIGSAPGRGVGGGGHSRTRPSARTKRPSQVIDNKKLLRKVDLNFHIKLINYKNRIKFQQVN